MKTNTSMTIYNKYFNPITRGDSWKRHVISEVFWDSNRSVTTGRDMARIDRVNVFIPFNANYMTYFTDPITFKSNPDNYWTIQNGDIIVKGTVTDEITKQSELESKYNDVLTVSTFTIKDFGSSNMRHIEVVGS